MTTNKDQQQFFFLLKSDRSPKNLLVDVNNQGITLSRSPLVDKA